MDSIQQVQKEYDDCFDDMYVTEEQEGEVGGGRSEGVWGLVVNAILYLVSGNDTG